MGVSDLIPGVSGGTIAVVLGIYERLLAAIIRLVIGSIAVMFLGIPTGGMSIVSSIITFILGFVIVSYFSKK
ncbi:DUF368 domain-containing protein [Bacillus bingmayongensis]|uniref:DUF368 domain-containing protein n=1 Tax=Bacillus bingmayongensis TaxID=1150157 RepID=A0ABU5JY25_9BACI|nr:DUF368 domain-containing protein [Bacillus bingmayongensis]MBY0596764.1 DUF368 domain-containing protein [Bacillus bingmayongensis]MDZ5608344.1 DUF368 domain-containing protein [Bacillus pseudomycoides]